MTTSMLALRKTELNPDMVAAFNEGKLIGYATTASGNFKGAAVGKLHRALNSTLPQRVKPFSHSVNCDTLPVSLSAGVSYRLALEFKVESVSDTSEGAGFSFSLLYRPNQAKDQGTLVRELTRHGYPVEGTLKVSVSNLDSPFPNYSAQLSDTESVDNTSETKLAQWVKVLTPMAEKIYDKALGVTLALPLMEFYLGGTMSLKTVSKLAWSVFVARYSRESPNIFLTTEAAYTMCSLLGRFLATSPYSSVEPTRALVSTLEVDWDFLTKYSYSLDENTDEFEVM